jgi:hypothetical protein
MLDRSYSEIRFNMGATPKAAKKPVPKWSDDDELGMWVDSALIARLHGQPSTSLHQAPPNGSSHILHFADLALGTVKPDKFKSAKVSKMRKTE